MAETETKIREMIIERYGSLKKFCEIIDMPWTTLDSILKRGIANSNITNVMKITKELGIDTESLASGVIVESSAKHSSPTTIAAHFDGNEYTEEELDKIKEFAAFVKSTRKNEDKRVAQKTAAPAPAADAPITFPDHLTVNAAHARNDVEATDEMQQHDEDIMDDENF